MFYVYVLQSESDAGFYIGFSTDLRRRLKDHQEGKSFATSYRGPWRLIYYEAYLEEADALGREKFLKSGGGRRFLKTQLRHYLVKHPLRPAALGEAFYASDSAAGKPQGGVATSSGAGAGEA